MAKTNLKDIASAMGVSSEEPKSRITVDEKDWAGVKDLKVGDSVELAITGKVVNVGKAFDGDGTNATIEVDTVQSDEEEDATDTDGE
jgi:hypothetical protein